MSALPPKAGMRDWPRHVGFVPEADIRIATDFLIQWGPCYRSRYCNSKRQVHRAPLARKTGNLAIPKKDPARRAVAQAAIHPAPRRRMRANTKIRARLRLKAAPFSKMCTSENRTPNQFYVNSSNSASRAFAPLADIAANAPSISRPAKASPAMTS